MVLALPIALNKDGERVLPRQTSREEGPFTCLGCGHRCIVKQGKIKVWHFSHHVAAGGAVGGCGGEGLFHEACKTWISTNIASLRIMRRCQCCEKEEQLWSASPVVTAKIEVEFSVEGRKYSLDVGVWSINDSAHTILPDVAVEVHHTHKCTLVKLKDLDGVLTKRKVFEVDAFDINTERNTLYCTRPHVCDTCYINCKTCGITMPRTCVDNTGRCLMSCAPIYKTKMMLILSCFFKKRIIRKRRFEQERLTQVKHERLTRFKQEETRRLARLARLAQVEHERLEQEKLMETQRLERKRLELERERWKTLPHIKAAVTVLQRAFSTWFKWERMVKRIANDLRWETIDLKRAQAYIEHPPFRGIPSLYTGRSLPNGLWSTKNRCYYANTVDDLAKLLDTPCNPPWNPKGCSRQELETIIKKQRKQVNSKKRTTSDQVAQEPPCPQLKWFKRIKILDQ